jgi:hypothetical protein
MVEDAKRLKVQFLCGNCGSTKVSRDAWGDWDVRMQRWDLRCVFDYAHCHDCDGETWLTEALLEE